MSAVAAAPACSGRRYRHFADETELFRACAAHLNAAHPSGDLRIGGDGRSRRPPGEGTGGSLRVHRRGEPMLANLIRDAPLVPSMQHESAG